uniref:EGF-like domain-containing protein n=1 Tax=Chromera velia CCMP2878 TaxID=1169474 RepID=A0A0G4HZ75_9ALVE|eukprot:Cvel_1562.t1-p1 / transcript=Cvel_1562.t1 / gene=Cvel_1562 / organism=Chromera_velia_CCMP2878 / gene_product=hypothetical protein / transcript_product=hypothetical protein / location=Cvel_scaffold55:120685-130951(+) / protein_length=439 / sequence_SO=supercontig / SO=protein_coding / is_pseudo=false
MRRRHCGETASSRDITMLMQGGRVGRKFAGPTEDSFPDLKLDGLFNGSGLGGKLPLGGEGLKDKLPDLFGDKEGAGSFGDLLSGFWDKEDKKVPECDPPCANGGVCSAAGGKSKDKGKTFKCNCLGTGFAGPTCEDTPIDITCGNAGDLAEVNVANSISLDTCTAEDYGVALNAEGAVAAPHLVEIQSNDLMEAINFPSLKTVEGDAVFQSNDEAPDTGLKEICLDALETIVGEIDLSSNDLLEKVSMNALKAHSDLLKITSNDFLADIFFTSLESVGGDVFIQSNDDDAGRGLINLQMPALVSVGGDLSVASNDALPSLFFPSLVSVGDSVQCDGNDVLESFCAPLLSEVADNFVLGTAPHLTTVCVDTEIVVGDIVNVNGDGISATNPKKSSDPLRWQLATVNCPEEKKELEKKEKEEGKKDTDKGLFSVLESFKFW